MCLASRHRLGVGPPVRSPYGSPHHEVVQRCNSPEEHQKRNLNPRTVWSGVGGQQGGPGGRVSGVAPRGPRRGAVRPYGCGIPGTVRWIAFGHPPATWLYCTVYPSSAIRCRLDCFRASTGDVAQLPLGVIHAGGPRRDQKKNIPRAIKTCKKKHSKKF